MLEHRSGVPRWLAPGRPPRLGYPRKFSSVGSWCHSVAVGESWLGSGAVGCETLTEFAWAVLGGFGTLQVADGVLDTY